MELVRFLNAIDESIDGQWSILPKVSSFEFSNQRYIYTTHSPNEKIVRKFRVTNPGSGNDPVLLLQNTDRNGIPAPGGFKFDNEDNIHQVFYINEIVGITFK